MAGGDSKKTTARSAASRAPVQAPAASAESEEEEEAPAEVEEPVAKVEEKVEKKAVETKPAQVVETKKEANASQQDKTLPEIPSHVQYLIVGGGTAALSAFKAIRASDATARVSD